MFNKKLKAITGFLALVIALLTIIPITALKIGCSKPVSEEEKISEEEMIEDLRRYRHLIVEPDDEPYIEAHHVLNEIQIEKARRIASKEGHEELYQLWLIEMLDRVSRFLDPQKGVTWKLWRFEEQLMREVEIKAPEVYRYHETEGYTAEQIRGCLVGNPGYYDFRRLRR